MSAQESNKKYTPKEELGMVLNNKEMNYFPRVIPINTPIIGMMKYSGIYWPEAHKDAKLMAKLASTAIEMTGFNATNVPFDMVVEAEALGCRIVWNNDISSTPQVRESIFKNFENINFKKNILKKGRFPVVLESIKLLKEKYEENIPIIPFIEGPYTIAGLSVGINEMFKIMLKDPKKAKKIINIFSELCILYGNAQANCGADYILLLDPNVSGLGGQQFKEIIIPMYKKIFKEIKKNVILHICGNVNRILEFIPESGFAAFSFDHPSMRIETVKNTIGEKMKLVGCVPTITCLLTGTKKDAFKQSINCISKGIDILSASCCIPPEVKIQNLKEMARAIEYWNKN